MIVSLEDVGISWPPGEPWTTKKWWEEKWSIRILEYHWTDSCPNVKTISRYSRLL